MIIAILSGPTFIAFLRRNEFGQQIREEGPQEHHAKAGTPTMGGIIIFTAIAIPFLLLTDLDWRAIGVFGAAVACALLGFADDYTKLRHKRSLGLRGRWKMVLLLGITAAVGLAAHHQHLSHSVYVPAASPSTPSIRFTPFAVPAMIRKSSRYQNGPRGTHWSRIGTNTSCRSCW